MLERIPLVLIHLLVALLFMALTSFLPVTPSTNDGDGHHHHHHRQKSKTKPRQPPPTKAPAVSSWEQLKTLLSCRSAAAPSRVHDPSKPTADGRSHARLGKSCGSSICALRDVVHGSTRVVHRSDSTDHNSSTRSDSGRAAERETAPLTRSAARHGGAHRPAPAVAPRGGMQLRRLSGCYECHAVDADSASRRYPRPRTLSACSECGEVFTKPESLELHQTLRHAVSELGPEDSGRNIVEIIFMSSWQKRDHPICRIERILKVHNTPRTIARFEDYRVAVKASAALAAAATASAATPGTAARHGNPKKNPRCAADGNELLRFHCASLACPLGARGSTALCCSPAAPACGVCGVIRHGFPRGSHVRTTASSGRAHDGAGAGGGARAMLVCRVIAGPVRRGGEDGGVYDSVAGEEGPYGNMEELYVANARAILPCFVVVYSVVE